MTTLEPPVAGPRPRVPGGEARAGRSHAPSLIPSLEDIQRRHGWLPREQLEALSRTTKRPLYEIQGIVSFYPHFRTDPPAGVALHVCHDLPCWLAGVDDDAIAALRRRHADDDVEVTEVSCLGRCDHAPAVAVDGRPARWSEAEGLVERARAGDVGTAEVAGADAVAGTDAAVAGTDAEPWPNDPYAPGEPRYRTLLALLEGRLTPAEVLDTLDDAGLRGMGGAGFPTGRKWRLVAEQQAATTYVICNADESEPGTFKDREILGRQPHLVLEGLLVAMVVVGAEEGWVFIRHEYGPEEDAIRAELDRLRADGLVGPDVGGRRLEVDVFVSPGGYILGEETALLECMEGHRGEPRNKPPFPGVHGLWGQPTLLNNVETLAAVPIVVERGARWWRDQGVGDAAGLKLFAVSGHVSRPDVYWVPMGTPLRDLLAMAGGVSQGRELAAVQPGGASSNLLGPDQLDVPLDFAALAEAGSMLGSGAVVVLADGTDLLAATTNVLRFFRDESCGKCVPCRVGSTKAHALLTEVVATGQPLAGPTLDTITDLEAVMRRTSICGLGQVALGPVLSVLGFERGGTAARDRPLEP
jgi:formate dehydrogenase beta subunit